jgi:hypothetical protein
MSLLSWYPLNPVEFREVVGNLSPLRQGALRMAMDAAWRSSEQHPCALPDDDEAIENIFGADDPALVAAVRRFFKPDANDPGWLRWPWFTALYESQLAKFRKRSTAGALGGKARVEQSRDNGTNRSGNASTHGSGNASRNGGNATQKLEVTTEKRYRGNAEALLEDAAVGRGGATAASSKSTDELRALMACDPDYAARVDALVSARIEREQIPPKFAPSARTVYLFEAMHEAYQQRQPELVA